MKNILLLYVIFLIGTGILSAQEQKEADGDFVGLKSKDGMRLIYNFSSAGFTLDLKGTVIDRVESDNLMLNINGKFIQVIVIPDFEVVKENLKDLTESTILQKHKDYELKYMEDTYQTKLSTNDSVFNINGKINFYWDYYVPLKQNTEDLIVKKQLFLTTALPGHVLMLSGLVTEKDNEDVIRDYMKSTMKTLYIDNIKPISVEAVKLTLQAESKTGK